MLVRDEGLARWLGNYWRRVGSLLWSLGRRVGCRRSTRCFDGGLNPFCSGRVRRFGEAEGPDVIWALGRPGPWSPWSISLGGGVGDTFGSRWPTARGRIGHVQCHFCTFLMRWRAALNRSRSTRASVMPHRSAPRRPVGLPDGRGARGRALSARPVRWKRECPTVGGARGMRAIMTAM